MILLHPPILVLHLLSFLTSCVGLLSFVDHVFSCDCASFASVNFWNQGFNNVFCKFFLLFVLVFVPFFDRRIKNSFYLFIF
jgi:hypothetical protein